MNINRLCSGTVIKRIYSSQLINQLRQSSTKIEPYAEQINDSEKVTTQKSQPKIVIFLPLEKNKKLFLFLI